MVKGLKPTVLAFREVVAGVMKKAKYAEFNDAYHLDRNPDTQLRAGWGIQIDGGSQGTGIEQCTTSFSRVLTVVISCEAQARDSDVERRLLQELELFSRMEELVLAVKSELTLGGLIYKNTFQGDTGRQEVFLENTPYYYIEVSFDVEYALSNR